MKNLLIFSSLLFLISSASAQEPFVHNIVAPNPWQDWKLVIVSLNKEAKPMDKAELNLGKPIIIKKENGPEITVQDIPLEPIAGKLLRIQCNELMVTQKFEEVSQLKGWATQMTCSKQNYYFIINPHHYQ